MKPIDRVFRSKYKAVAFNRRIDLMDQLRDFLMGNRQFRFLYPSLLQSDCKLDTSRLEETLKHYFGSASHFIVDYDEPFEGGYRKFAGPTFGQLCTKDDLDKCIISESENFINEVDSIHHLFSSLNIILAKSPTNLKERIMVLNDINIVNGKIRSVNLKAISNYIEALIVNLFKGFSYNQLVSSSVVRRYTKKIDLQFSISITVDYFQTKVNSTTGKLVLPSFYAEILGLKLNRNVKEKVYLKYQEEHPIARVALGRLYGFLNSPYVVANLVEDELYIKHILQYNILSGLSFLKIHLREVENTVNACCN